MRRSGELRDGAPGDSRLCASATDPARRRVMQGGKAGGREAKRRMPSRHTGFELIGSPTKSDQLEPLQVFFRSRRLYIYMMYCPMVFSSSTILGQSDNHLGLLLSLLSECSFVLLHRPKRPTRADKRV